MTAGPGRAGPEASAPPPSAWWLLPAVAYAALIFWLSHQPNPLPALTAALSDKLLHGAEYGGLAGLLALGLHRAGVRGIGRAALLAAALASAYGASDEWHQSFVPHRTADVLDWVADSLGAAAGALLAFAALRRPWSRASIRR